MNSRVVIKIIKIIAYPIKPSAIILLTCNPRQLIKIINQSSLSLSPSQRRKRRFQSQPPMTIHPEWSHQLLFKNNHIRWIISMPKSILLTWQVFVTKTRLTIRISRRRIARLRLCKMSTNYQTQMRRHITRKPSNGIISTIKISKSPLQ